MFRAVVVLRCEGVGAAAVVKDGRRMAATSSRINVYGMSAAAFKGTNSIRTISEKPREKVSIAVLSSSVPPTVTILLVLPIYLVQKPTNCHADGYTSSNRRLRFATLGTGAKSQNKSFLVQPKSHLCAAF